MVAGFIALTTLSHAGLCFAHRFREAGFAMEQLRKWNNGKGGVGGGSAREYDDLGLDSEAEEENEDIISTIKKVSF